MRFSQIITEKAIPDSHYGYWVTTDGEILAVPYQSHSTVAREKGGFASVYDAEHYGWAAIYYQGYGEFGLRYSYLTNKTASGIRALLKMAEQSGCHKYVIEGPGGRLYDSPVPILRGLASSLRFWNKETKERIAKGLPARRPYRNDDDDDDF